MPQYQSRFDQQSVAVDLQGSVRSVEKNAHAPMEATLTDSNQLDERFCSSVQTPHVFTLE